LAPRELKWEKKKLSRKERAEEAVCPPRSRAGVGQVTVLLSSLCKQSESPQGLRDLNSILRG
jgi:hypothetical protein